MAPISLATVALKQEKMLICKNQTNVLMKEKFVTAQELYIMALGIPLWLIHLKRWPNINLLARLSALTERLDMILFMGNIRNVTARVKKHLSVRTVIGLLKTV